MYTLTLQKMKKSNKVKLEFIDILVDRFSPKSDWSILETISNIFRKNTFISEIISIKYERFKNISSCDNRKEKKPKDTIISAKPSKKIFEIRLE